MLNTIANDMVMFFCSVNCVFAMQFQSVRISTGLECFSVDLFYLNLYVVEHNDLMHVLSCTQKYILEVISDLFRLNLPVWTEDFATAFSSVGKSVVSLCESVIGQGSFPVCMVTWY